MVVATLVVRAARVVRVDLPVAVVAVAAVARRHMEPVALGATEKFLSIPGN